jgi:serine/threonine protein kinase
MEDLQGGDPANVGRYRLLGRLGTGGMGQVFLGVSPGGRRVAVKLIHPALAGSPQFRQRFAREIEAARRVGGFHTAPVVDADPDADPPWMVTAYIKGPSLEEAIRQEGPMPPDQVRVLGAGLAEGLAAIHACGLVHRDLKPANVIIGADGPRIIDFGTARAEGAARLTTAGMTIGTFAWMSPEQFRGDLAGPPSDVFSLGCVLAFAATGRLPFGGESVAAVMLRVRSMAPDLAGLNDRSLQYLIESCLEKEPGARPIIPELLAALTQAAPGRVRGRSPDDVPTRLTPLPYEPRAAIRSEMRTPALGQPALGQSAVGPPAVRGPAVRRPPAGRTGAFWSGVVAVAAAVVLIASVAVALTTSGPAQKILPRPHLAATTTAPQATAPPAPAPHPTVSSPSPHPRKPGQPAKRRTSVKRKRPTRRG